MSDIGNPITAIENEAWVEAVARALTASWGMDPEDSEILGVPAWHAHEAEARAAIRALAPLIIERCAEVAGKEATDFKLWKNLEASYGCSVVSDAIRALIQKEASDGEV